MIKGGCGWIIYHKESKKKEHIEFWSQKHKATNPLENKALCSTKLHKEQGLKTGTGFN
jgi:hypothetical protein